MKISSSAPLVATTPSVIAQSMRSRFAAASEPAQATESVKLSGASRAADAGTLPGDPLRDPKQALPWVKAWEKQLNFDPATEKERRDLMAEGAQKFYRMFPALFHQDMDSTYAAELAGLSPRKAPQVMISGDCHVDNFGTMRAPGGKPLWAINDFDQGAPGPVSKDIVRLATSLVLAGQDNSSKEKLTRHLINHMIDGYVAALQSVVDNGPPPNAGILLKNAKGPVWDVLNKASKKTPVDLLAKFAEPSPNGYKLQRNNDLVNLTAAQKENVQSLISQAPPGANNFTILDCAQKKHSGGSSRGLDRYYVLCQGPEPKSLPFILEMKELLPPCVEVPSADLSLANADKDLEAMKRMGAPLWKTDWAARVNDRAFLVREREPEKEGVDSTSLDVDGLKSLASQTGCALALGHGRSVSQARTILDYIGKDPTVFKEKLIALADTYAAQVHADFSAVTGK